VRDDRITPRRIEIGHRPIEPASDYERQQQKADEITFSHRESSPHDSQIYEFPSISPASSSKQAFPEDELLKLPAPSSKMAFIEDEMVNRPCSSSKNVLFEDGLWWGGKAKNLNVRKINSKGSFFFLRLGDSLHQKQ
jgi:hypothetical protein